MLTLSLIWLALGALLGAAATWGRLTPPHWEARRWLALPPLGAGVALLGGWLGTLLLDHLFATLVAIWLCVAAMYAVSLLTRRAAKVDA